jgi:hypothetical protein
MREHLRQYLDPQADPGIVDDYIWPGPGSPAEWCISGLI